MKGRTPTFLLWEKFPRIQSSNSSLSNSSEQPVGLNANAEESGSGREQLVSYLKAEGLADPDFKGTKLGVINWFQ